MASKSFQPDKEYWYDISSEGKFNEYNVFFDFLIDVLGEEKVLYRVTEFTERLSESDRQQIADYKKGIKNKAWMLNRSNLRFVVDNGYI